MEDVPKVMSWADYVRRLSTSCASSVCIVLGVWVPCRSCQHCMTCGIRAHHTCMTPKHVIIPISSDIQAETLQDSPEASQPALRSPSRVYSRAGSGLSRAQSLGRESSSTHSVAASTLLQVCNGLCCWFIHVNQASVLPVATPAEPVLKLMPQWPVGGSGCRWLLHHTTRLVQGATN